MTIVFNCPGCDSKMQAPENLAGRQARCPSCQTVVTVPEKVFEAEEVASYPAEPPRPRPRPVEEPLADPNEVAEEEQRPCPMCGEMIQARALKCRFCGEIFDPALRRRSGSPAQQRTIRSLMNGVGGLWIFFGALVLLGTIFLSSEAQRLRGRGGMDVEGLLIILGIVSLVWLTVGICACAKQMWAVYVGLVLSYIGIVGQVVNLVGGQGGGPGGGAGPQACGAIFAVCLLVAGIVQSHRIISLSGQVNRGRRPYE